jgi:TolB-like protein
MSLQPGSKCGRYEIVSLLGSGGMGEVYRAHDTRLGRDVALKVLPEAAATDPSYRRRLEVEAQIISRLQHPHICTLHDLDRDGETLFLVMELLEGETLADRLQRGPLPADDLRRIAREVAEAVEAAHRQGIVHRDLKPGNIMLAPAGTKVLDFGLAKDRGNDPGALDSQAATELTPLTREGTLVGTLPYMAPEQLEGRPADTRTDIWALGCLLYEMATSERPFTGTSQASLINAILGSQPEPPSRKQPLSPERLDHIVRRCLEKDPERRWQSARDVALELEAIGSVVDVSDGDNAADATSAQSASADLLPQRRLPMRALVAAAAVIALVAFGGVWLTEGARGKPEATLTSPLAASRLAVLPIRNETGREDLNPATIALRDELATRFVPLRPVAPRGASIAQAGAGTCEAAATMDARHVLDGGLGLTDDGLRLRLELVECPDNEILWSGEYTTVSSDDARLDEHTLFCLIQSVYPVMGVSTILDDPRSPALPFNEMTPEGNLRALDNIREGTESYPTEETWHAWEAYVLIQAINEGWYDSRDEALERMSRAASKCLKLNPNNYRCHDVAGIAHLLKGSFEEARTAFEYVRDLTFGSQAADTLALALAHSGRGEEALALLEQTDCSRDRPSPGHTYDLARVHFALGNYEQARDLADQTVDRMVNTRYNYLATAYTYLAASHALLGASEQAARALERALGLRPLLAKTYPGELDPLWRGLKLAGLELEPSVSQKD